MSPPLGAAGAVIAIRSARPQALVDEIRADGAAAPALAGEVTRGSAVGTLIAQGLERHGRLDILVTNVGEAVSATPGEGDHGRRATCPGRARDVRVAAPQGPRPPGCRA